MKTGLLANKGIVILVLAILTSLPFAVFAQPDYRFVSPILEAGSNLQIGAQYRFSNIKSGVDALVTITDMTNGMTLSEIDGTSSGFNEAFQPFINVPSNNEGYVEFRFDFVDAGTNTPVSLAEVPFTAIDIDGEVASGGRIYEFDQFQMDDSYLEDYDLLGNSLTVTHTSLWAESRNRTAVNYNGIDTVQQDVMYTGLCKNVSSVMYRTGAVSTESVNRQRLRSVYFKKFAFANGLLPVYGLTSFTGVATSTGADLSFTVSAQSNFETAVIERNDNNKGFLPVGSVNIFHTGSEQTMKWHDASKVEGQVIYRLKFISPGGKFNYSNVLVLKGRTDGATGFKIYPNMVQSDATLSLNSSRKRQVTIRIADLSGRIVSQQQAQLGAGSNSVQLQGLSNLSRGNYVVVVENENIRQAQQIVKL